MELVVSVYALARRTDSCVNSCFRHLLAVPVRVRGSQAATKLSEFFRDRDKLLRGKVSPEKFEAKWRGVRIAGQEVFADVAAIFLRANADDLKVETLYASVGGAE